VGSLHHFETNGKYQDSATALETTGDHMRCWSSRWIAVLFLGLGAGCGQKSAAPEDNWSSFVDGFIETYFAANPLFAAYQGRHEYDGIFPDWSDAGLKRWLARLHQLRDSAAVFPLDTADAMKRFERDYLIAIIDRDLFWGEQADLPHRNPEFYSGTIDPNVYIAREYAPLERRMRAFTRYAGHLPRALAQVRANLRTPLPRPFAEIGRGRFGGLAGYLKQDVPRCSARWLTPESGASSKLPTRVQ